MAKPTPKRPLKRETLADRVSADITERILTQELVGGAALPTEPELAESYGVSRSVIRDATRLLAARGLVDPDDATVNHVTPGGLAAKAIMPTTASDTIPEHGMLVGDVSTCGFARDHQCL